MTRNDERKEIAGMARTPAAARRDEEKDDVEHVSREADDREGPAEGEMSSMARTPAGARRGAEQHREYEDRAQRGDRDVVRGGQADHVFGPGAETGEFGTATAEGMADMASGKANRKEAGEPEREANEKAAMGRERTPAHKNTMGHGERETIAKHTI